MTRISGAAADDKTTEYTWDYRNRLTKVVEKNNAGTITQSIDYVYDVFDRRIEKSFDADGADGGTAVVTRWAYDGDDVILTVDATGLVTHRYVHGPAVDQILADDATGAEKYFPLTDNLGSVRDIIDHSGNVENHLVYSAYGQVTSETTSAFNFHFGYTGRERDEETGLDGYRRRAYDSARGIFASEDWLGILSGDSNFARYVANNPTNYTDPSGLQGFWSNYWHYLTNPSQMDDDLETGFYIAGGTALVAGGAAGGLVLAGYGGVTVLAAAKASAPVIAAQVGDYAFETATGIPLIVSPADALKDAARWGVRRLMQESAEEAAERAIRRAPSATPIGSTWVDGICFLAGDAVLLPDGAVLAEGEAMSDDESEWNSWAASSVVVAAGIVGGSVLARRDRRRKQRAAAERDRVFDNAQGEDWLWGQAVDVLDDADVSTVEEPWQPSVGARIDGALAVQDAPVAAPVKMRRAAAFTHRETVSRPVPKRRAVSAGVLCFAASVLIALFLGRGAFVSNSSAPVDGLAAQSEATLSADIETVGVGQRVEANGDSADAETAVVPDNIIGHHINDVARFPEWAGDPRNIEFVRGQAGNLQQHGGNFRNGTTGPLIDR